MAKCPKLSVLRELAFLISSGTGSGKTTLLSALLALVPRTERVLIVEDSRELVAPFTAERAELQSSARARHARAPGRTTQGSHLLCYAADVERPPPARARLILG